AGWCRRRRLAVRGSRFGNWELGTGNRKLGNRKPKAGRWELEAGSPGVNTMIEQHYLDDALRQLRKLKIQADKALAQTTEEHGFATLDPESNSIAIIMKHMA